MQCRHAEGMFRSSFQIGVPLQPLFGRYALVRVLGMRGTGSHDILIERALIPEADVFLRRPQGKWHLLFHVISLFAIPLIYSVYLGLAEAARDIAIQRCRNSRETRDLPHLVGEMENELAAVRLAHRDMLDAAATEQPGKQTTNRIMTGRAILGRSVIRSVEKAMKVAGGVAFYRDVGLERRFRDVQAARYHLQDKAQLHYAGRLALGLDVDG